MIQFRKSFVTPVILSTFAAAFAGIPHPAAAQDRAYAVEPVAVTGESAPGTGGLTFQSVGRGDLSDTGIVAFTAAASIWSGEDDAIWVGSPGNLTLAVRGGDPAPGRVAQTFYQFGPIVVNAGGDIWFGATLREDGATTSGGAPGGFWSGAPGNLSSVVGPGEPAPGTAGFSFESFGFIGNFDDSGVSTFGARVATSAGDSLPGLWTGTPGSLELLALSGDPAPDTADLLFSGFADPVADNTGTKAFLAATVDPNLEYGDGIWIAGPAGANLLARSGEPAPGTGGRSFVSLAYGSLWGAAGAGGDLTAEDTAGPVLNRSGDVAFNGFLAPYDPVTGIADEGIWIHDTIGLRLVSLVGDPAPGATGLTLIDFNHINMNALGQVAFDAALDSGDPASDRGIWLGLPDNLGLLVREGDPAPGTVGETFANLAMGPSLNSLGEIAFYARLNESNNKGIWAGTANDLALIVSEGEVLRVKSGDYRTVYHIIPFEGGPSAHAGNRRFNEAGQTLFNVLFTDGTRGLFLATPVDATTNLPPVADAGPDLSVPDGNSITIDGSGSFDPEQTILKFVWSIGGVEVATGLQYEAHSLAAGTHTVTLTVTDRGGASASDDMILIVVNEAPVARAGPDQTVSYVETVDLNGSFSSDPEGDALTYEWSLGGTQIATGVTATVGPFAVGGHTITLTVTDDIGNSTTDSMIVTVFNAAPLANAGPDQTANHAQTATLAGSGSDPEGGPLTYAWSLGDVQIETGVNPTVGPFAVGIHTVTLTVTDDHGATATDSMTVTVINEAPVANAGPDQTVKVKGKTTTVTLDGSASSDPEGGILSYAWTLNGQTVGTGAAPQVAVPAGVHVFTLTVTDDHGATAADGIVVTAIKGNKGA
jgi:PKD repeat protein